MPLPTIQRTIDQIQRDISWKFQRVNDSQEHAQIVKLEEDIAKLQRELKTVQNATQLPTPDEPMVGDEKLLKRLDYLASIGSFSAIEKAAQTIRRLQSELAAANARADGEYAKGIEDAANWHIQQGQYYLNSMNCGSENGDGKRVDAINAKHVSYANSIRALLPNSKKEPHEQA
jgi:hypothetical protein